MILYILALFSLILVIPILFLLPIGLSKRGKLIIIGFGFFISLLGIMSRSLFPIWQSALIMLLFLIISTYFIMRKGATILFSKEEEEEIDAPSNSLFEDSAVVEPKVVTFLSKLEEDENEMVITELVPQVSGEVESESKEELELESLDLDVDLELLEKTTQVLEEEELLHARVDREESYYLEQEKEIEATNIGYMAEIEKMLEQDSFSGEEVELAEKVSPLPIFDDIEVAVSSERDNQSEDKNHTEELNLDVDDIEEIPLLDLKELIPERELEKEEEMEEAEILSDMERLNQLEEFTLLDLKEEISEIDIEEEAIAELENLSDMEMLDELAGFAIEAKDDNPLESIEDELIELPKEEELSILAHKIINNTLSQLNVMKDTLDKQEFEMLLLQCMKNSIPLNEYFAFSTMLVDHYLNNNEIEKLQHLLLSMKDKYRQQPIVLEQINFMEEKYLN